MLSEKRVTARRTIPFLLIGLLIFVAYLYFFIGIPEMLTVMQRVNLFYYLLAVAILILNMLVSSLIWQYFLRPLSVNAPLKKTFLITWIGAFVDLLVPAESISGDATKVYLMSKESGENTGKVVASVVSHRILSMIITLGTLIISSLSLLILQYELNSLVSISIVLVAIGTVVSLILIVLLCIREQLTRKLIDLLLRFSVFISRGRLDIAKLRFKAKKALDAFHQSIEVLRRNPRNLVQPAILSMISWLLGVLLSFIVYISLGHPVSFVPVTIVYSITCTLQNIPMGVPGEVGFVEVVMTNLYGLLGVPYDISAAATVLIRFLTVWFKLLIGFVLVQRIGIKTLLGGA